MYRLTGRLEQGDLADLLLGVRVESGEPVVVKLFHERTSDSAYAQVISANARTLAPLAGQRIAQVCDIGFLDGRLAVVRRDVGRLTLGLALQRLNTREVVLPPALAIVFVLEILEVLSAAHGVGVVHGALTPGNVLMSEDGLPWLAEFGALAALQASDDLRSTFAARGRTSYRAPELKTASTVATVESDLYAAAAIAYELLTLREASIAGPAISTRAERVPPPSRLVRRLNARIDPPIMRALEPTPGRRHRSCAEFANELKEFLAAQGGLPPREDLKKFVRELFPNEVTLAAPHAPPFENEFVLTPIDGVGRVASAPPAVGPRIPFSGGMVDERTPTSDGLPVFGAEADAPKTDPLLPQQHAPRPEPSWEAPAPTVPHEIEAQTLAPAAKRLRQLEAFDVSDNLPSVLESSGTTDEASRAKRTVKTFAVNFRRDGEPDERVDFDLEQWRARRRARISSLIGTTALVTMVASLALAFWFQTPDVRGTLASYLPRPLGRLVEASRPPIPPPPPVARVGPSVVLPDFDAPRAHTPETPSTPAVPTPPPRAPTVTPDCYLGPKGRSATLLISSVRKVHVEIDGAPVCGSTSKLAVVPGSHAVRIIDPATHRDATTVVQFAAGKTVKLSAPERNR